MGRWMDARVYMNVRNFVCIMNICVCGCMCVNMREYVHYLCTYEFMYVFIYV
jgi:hypothetical protein